jgi:hypothetical protein
MQTGDIGNEAAAEELLMGMFIFASEDLQQSTVK